MFLFLCFNKNQAQLQFIIVSNLKKLIAKGIWNVILIYFEKIKNNTKNSEKRFDKENGRELVVEITINL